MLYDSYVTHGLGDDKISGDVQYLSAQGWLAFSTVIICAAVDAYLHCVVGCWVDDCLSSRAAAGRKRF